MVIVALLALLAMGLIAAYFIRVDSTSGPPQPVYVEAPRGSSSWEIGERLTQAGLIRHPAQYVLARLAHGRGAQAGEYEFRRPATPLQIAEKLARGEIFRIELRVPEGSDLFDLAELVEESGFSPAREFLRVARSRKLINELAPGAPSLEGYLFPSTYRFARKTTPEQICRAMAREMRNVCEQLGAKDSMHRVLTLASLVEKEARLPEERGRIAGVFHNRLQKGMKLECDPTVIYASRLEGRWRGVIYRSDLDSRNAYNTYQHAGLPPGPIAGPGRAAIQAALRPEATDALFFVVLPGSGGAHTFSRDLNSHERAVAEYRNAEQKTKRAPQSPRVARGKSAPHR